MNRRLRDLQNSTLDVIAIIPARAGSKRVPEKNLLPIAGIPLLVYSLRHAATSKYVRQIYVSTEDSRIAHLSLSNGAIVVPRPIELASDRATSESALLHVLDYRKDQGLSDPDLVVFLQCTSPVRRPKDIDAAIDLLLASEADSLFSACINTGFIWSTRNDRPYPLNYDFRNRPREQDMEKQWLENGSLYIFKPEILRKYGNRLGGKIVVFEMDYWSSFQLDTFQHVELLQWILARPEFQINKLDKDLL